MFYNVPKNLRKDRKGSLKICIFADPSIEGQVSSPLAGPDKMRQKRAG